MSRASVVVRRQHRVDFDRPHICLLGVGGKVAIPRLSPEQLEAARAAATEARRARAALKHDVREGRLTLSAALDKAAQDDVLAHVKVVDLLRSLPRVGVKRADEIMERLGIAANRRIRGLGRYQVAQLKSEFE